MLLFAISEPDAKELFDSKAAALLEKLDAAWKNLNRTVNDNIPKNSEKLEDLIAQHKDFEDALQGLDSDVSMIQELFRQLRDPTPMQRSKLDTLMDRWDGLWELSRMYVDRLKTI